VVYGSPIPQFVISRDHKVIFWNLALEDITGIRKEEIIGTNQQWRAFYVTERPCMADLLVDGKTELIQEWYAGKCRRSKHVSDAYEATDFFPALSKEGMWLHFTAAVIKDSRGIAIGAVETLEDITHRKKMEEEALRVQKLERRSGWKSSRDAELRAEPGTRGASSGGILEVSRAAQRRGCPVQAASARRSRLCNPFGVLGRGRAALGGWARDLTERDDRQLGTGQGRSARWSARFFAS